MYATVFDYDLNAPINADMPTATMKSETNTSMSVKPPLRSSCRPR